MNWVVTVKPGNYLTGIQVLRPLLDVQPNEDAEEKEESAIRGEPYELLNRFIATQPLQPAYHGWKFWAWREAEKRTRLLGLVEVTRQDIIGAGDYAGDTLVAHIMGLHPKVQKVSFYSGVVGKDGNGKQFTGITTFGPSEVDLKFEQVRSGDKAKGTSIAGTIVEFLDSAPKINGSVKLFDARYVDDYGESTVPTFPPRRQLSEGKKVARWILKLGVAPTIAEHGASISISNLNQSAGEIGVTMGGVCGTCSSTEKTVEGIANAFSNQNLGWLKKLDILLNDGKNSVPHKTYNYVNGILQQRA